MKRPFPLAVAQLGPIHLRDSKTAVVARLIELLKEAHARHAHFVVFPELALTTFFPRYWMTDEAEIDRYFEASMPNADVQPLFDLARQYGIGFYLARRFILLP
jgi:predicted amidohydrolase